MKAYKNLFAINADATPSEIIGESGLDWTVESYPRYFRAGNGDFTLVPNKASIVRSDTQEELCVASDNWVPANNIKLVEMFYDFCKASNQLTLTHCGPLDGGKQIAMLADCHIEHDVLKKGDIVKASLLFTGSHLCGTGHGIKLFTERLVCTNGMTRSVTNTFQILRHTSSFIRDCDRMLAASLDGWQKFTEESDLLATMPMTVEEAHTMLIMHFGDPSKELDEQPKVVERVLELFDGEMMGGHLMSAYQTAYGLLQSVTEYYNHHHGYRASTDAFSTLTVGTVASNIARFNSSLLRPGLKQKNTPVRQLAFN